MRPTVSVAENSKAQFDIFYTRADRVSWAEMHRERFYLSISHVDVKLCYILKGPTRFRLDIYVAFYFFFFFSRLNAAGSIYFSEFVLAFSRAIEDTGRLGDTQRPS